MPPKKNGRKMPPPLPEREVLTDHSKKKWVIGTSIGKGGFGEIYLATPQGNGKKASSEKAEHVIKIEPLGNGPLFCELSYYRRAAKKDLIEGWISKMKLSYLGIPPYIASGNHKFKKEEYRFMVMQRFGEDLQKHFNKADRKFSFDTVSYLALRLLEALEFLHENEYVHGDIKGSNLLTGLGPSQAHRVYLVDYGLAYRYNPDESHQEYKKDPKRAHDGTLEYTSIDAHNGVSPSRRSDLEILAYCLLQWGCGMLPWEKDIANKDRVAQQKKKFRENVAASLKSCFHPNPPPSFLQPFMRIVFDLKYEDKPNYNELKKLFSDFLKGRNAAKSLEWISPAKADNAKKKVPRGRGKNVTPPVSSEEDSDNAKKKEMKGSYVRQADSSEDESDNAKKKKTSKVTRGRGRRNATPPDSSEDESDNAKKKKMSKVTRGRGRRNATPPDSSEEDSDNAKKKKVTRGRRNTTPPDSSEDESDNAKKKKMSKVPRGRGRRNATPPDSSEEDSDNAKKKKMSKVTRGRGRYVAPEEDTVSEFSEEDSDVKRKVSGKRGRTAKKRSSERKSVAFEAGVKEANDLPDVVYPRELGYTNEQALLHPRKRTLRQRPKAQQYFEPSGIECGDSNDDESEEEYSQEDSSWEEGMSPVGNTRKKLARNKGAHKYAESQSESEDESYCPTKSKRKRN